MEIQGEHCLIEEVPPSIYVLMLKENSYNVA